MNPKCTESVHKVYAKWTQSKHKVYAMWTQSKHKVYLNLQVYTKCTESVQKAYGSIHTVTFSMDTEFGFVCIWVPSFSEHISLLTLFPIKLSN